MSTDSETGGHPALTPRASAWYRGARLAFRILGVLLFRIHVTGRENVPAGNYIAIGNHLNWIDPFLMVMYLPVEPRLYFIGAQAAVNRGWKGWLLDHFDVMIPARRGAAYLGRDIIERPKEVLAAGAILGLYPEGKGGPTEGEMLPLERGVGHLVVATGLPVLPVAVSGVKELYLGKPIGMVIGKPVMANIEGLGHRAAIDAVMEQVEAALRAILPPYVEHKPRIKLMRFLTYLLDLGRPEPEWAAGPPGTAVIPELTRPGN